MKNYLYALGAIFCWASLPAATGSGLDGLPVNELMFYSFTCAAIYLYLQDVVMTKSFVLHIPPWPISLLGIWGIFLYHYVYYTALSYIPMAEGGILATTWSFWIVFFSSLLFFRKLKLSLLLVAATGMVGAAMVIADGSDISFSSSHTLGYLLALSCGIIWSTFSVTLSRFPVKKGSMTTFTIYAALISAILFAINTPHNIPRTSALLSAVYLGLIPLGFSFFCWNRAVDGGNMMVIGFLCYFTPPLGVLLVSIIHGESVSGQVLLGMLLILAASIGGKSILDHAQKESKEANNESSAADGES